MAEIRTEERKEVFLSAYEINGYHISNACKDAGITRKTFYNWKDADPEFLERYNEITEEDIDNSEKSMMLLRHGVPELDDDGEFVGWKVKPHFQALALHLQSKAKDRGWGQSIEVTRPKDDGRDLTDEELFAQASKLNEELQDDEWDTSKDGIEE